MIALLASAILCLTACYHAPQTIRTADVGSVLIHVNQWHGFEAFFIDDIDGIPTLVDYQYIDIHQFSTNDQTGRIIVRLEDHWGDEWEVSTETLAVQYGGERPLQNIRDCLKQFRVWPRPRIYLRGLADGR